MFVLRQQFEIRILEYLIQTYFKTIYILKHILGKANILWPGLSTPIIRGKELIEQQQLPEDPEREKKLIELRDKMGKFTRTKLSPIERGWSGAKLPGRSVGPPDPVGEETFEGFDTKVLELKTVFNMKGNLGRRRRQACMVVVGNSQGLAGFATAKAPDGKSVLRKAKNKAVQKLIHVDIFRGHTSKFCVCIKYV